MEGVSFGDVLRKSKNVKTKKFSRVCESARENFLRVALMGHS